MSFFRKHPVWTGVIAVLLVLTMIFITNGSKTGTIAENAVGSAVSPILSGFSNFTRNAGNWFRTVFGISDVQRENALLREQVAQLQGEAATTRELQKENERLRKIANYVEENNDYEYVTAQVISKNPGYWFDTFLINIGRNKDLESGMPVITPDGLVGRISEVYANWSKVESIIDPLNEVSGIVERTRDLVIVNGATDLSDEDSICHVLYSPSDLVPGDVIKTSGSGGGFPKGLMIGTILTTPRSSENSSERNAQLQPAVDFSNLEEVMVIRNLWQEVGP